jgi:hypothetical protein
MIRWRRTCALAPILFFLVSVATSRGQYYFGRNKVQYNKFRWQILKTKHFDIYFYPEMESLAEIGAYFAEESYHHLQDKFNHNILRRIPLIFYSSHFHFEETNTIPYLIPTGLGGFFEFIKGRVVVPSDGSLDRFRHTIRHELVHVFQRSYVQRILKDHRKLQGGYVPSWFSEGLAEYWSEGWSPEGEMIIRELVLNNTIVPIEQMSMISGTYLMYKEGQAVIKFISEHYGEEKILRILQNIWKEDSFSNVLKITIGKDYRELNEEWLYHLKKSVYPLMEKKDLPRMVTARVTDKGFNTLPAFYREGETAVVVFVANRDGYSSIYQKEVVDYREEKPTILVRGERTPELESFHLQKSRIDVDRKGRLAFVAKSGPQDVLFIFSIPERRILRRYKFSELVSLFSPSWSPDGTRIALIGLDQAGRNDLYIVQLEDGSITRLTDDFYDDQDPDWSPDGRWIVFSSDRTDSGTEGYNNLFLYDLQMGRIRYLTFGPYHDLSPAWSPDGRYIAFATNRDGISNIWIVEQGVGRDASGKKRPVYSLYDAGFDVEKTACMKQVTHFATGAFQPCWTDSLTLLFTALENLSFQIRAFSSVVEKLENSPVIEPDPLTKSSGVWIFPRMSGSARSSNVKYRRRFSLDFAQSQVVQDPIFGTSGGGQLAISDMLGDEQYYFLIFNNARTQSEFWDGFNFAVTRVDLSHRVNFSLGLYRLAGRYYNYYEGYFYENRYGGFGSVSYPLNKFERLETSINIRNSEKDWYGGWTRKAFLLSNFISYTKDNSLWGPTGPLDGVRYNITLGNTVDVRHSNVNFTTVMFDLRKYFRIGYRVSHALRVWGQFNHGKEPLPFFMGGSWDLRGYRLWSLWGTKLALISNEFRFPFIDQFYLGFPFGGLGFSSIRGALFVDAGNVWDDEFGDLKGSFGFGIRLRLGGYFVLRLDVGKKTNFKKIYSKTFTQFFFGWDF